MVVVARVRPQHAARGRPRGYEPEVTALIERLRIVELDLDAVLQAQPPAHGVGHGDAVVRRRALVAVVPATQQRMQPRVEGALGVGVLEGDLALVQRDAPDLHDAAGRPNGAQWSSMSSTQSPTSRSLCASRHDAESRAVRTPSPSISVSDSTPNSTLALSRDHLKVASSASPPRCTSTR